MCSVILLVANLGVILSLIQSLLHCYTTLTRFLFNMRAVCHPSTRFLLFSPFSFRQSIILPNEHCT